MILPNDWLFESIKLAAQLCGALLVAWLAVRWALGRFKKEKSWEKRLQAYCDIIVAISELDAILRSWTPQLASDDALKKEFKDNYLQRFNLAIIKLEEARAMASLLLPDGTATMILTFLEADHDLPEDTSPLDKNKLYLKELSKAKEHILQQGRKSLGVFY